MATIDNKVRRWLMTFPELIEADTPGEALRKAWAMSEVDCGVSDFQDALARAGFRRQLPQRRTLQLRAGHRIPLHAPGALLPKSHRLRHFLTPTAN